MTSNLLGIICSFAQFSACLASSFHLATSSASAGVTHFGSFGCSVKVLSILIITSLSVLAYPQYLLSV